MSSLLCIYFHILDDSAYNRLKYIKHIFKIPLHKTPKFAYFLFSIQLYWALIDFNYLMQLCFVCENRRKMAASWRKRLGARLPPLGYRVRVSVPPCGFHGGRNGVWVGFSRGFSRFPLPQISFHHFSTLISFISFHFIRPCNGGSGVVGRHPC